MTFRHRHFSLSRLIETAEVEPGKAEAAERKKQGVRRMKVQSDTRTTHAADGFWFPASLSSNQTTAFPHVARRPSKRLRKLAGEGRNQTPSPQRGGCRTLSSPTGRSTSRSSQRLLQEVLQIVVPGHLLADQAFDGKQLDHLVLVPNGKLATLRFHLQEDAASGQSPDRGRRWPDRHRRTHPDPHDADTPSDPAGPARHLGQPAPSRAGKVGKVGNATRGGTFPQERP
jgi:hypothetical protein